MRNFFTILLFFFANNLFAQDTIEVKRIDSFIENNGLRLYDEYSLKRKFIMPNCFAIGDIETEIFSYKFIKGTFFKFSDISLNNTGDTTQIVSFYFERLKLIKIEVLVSGKLRKLENHYSLYYKAQKLLLYRAGNFPFSDSIYNKNIDAHYLKRAKKLAKKAKTKSWKFPNY